MGGVGGLFQSKKVSLRFLMYYIESDKNSLYFVKQ